MQAKIGCRPIDLCSPKEMKINWYSSKLRLSHNNPLTIRKSLILFCLLLHIGKLDSRQAKNQVFSQQMGDRISVTVSTATKVRDAVVDQVYEGEIHTVAAVQKLGRNDWCSLEGVKGWMPLQNVMHLESAKKHFSNRISKNQNDFTALAHRGMIHYEQGDFNRAYQDLDASLKLNSRNPVTWNNRAWVLHAQGNFSAALRDIETALKLNPSFALARHNQGRVQHSINEWTKAIESYDQAINLDPNNPRFLVNRANSKLMLEEMSGAADDFLASLKLNPNNPDALVGLSNVLLSRDDLKAAWNYADQAIKLSPKDAFALNARGWASYKLGDLDAALQDLTRAVQIAPKFPLAYNNRGVCLAAKGNLNDAIRDYNRALDLRSANPVTIANRGNAWYRLGDFPKAQQDFTRAIETAMLPEAVNSMAWFLATCPEEKFRDGKKGIELAQRAIELSNEENWNFLKSLAASYAEDSDFENALAVIRKAWERAPNPEKAEIQKMMKGFQEKNPYRLIIETSAQ